MKLLALVILDVSVHGLHLKSAPSTMSDNPQTLREWLSDSGGVNVVLTPQYNNQHSMFGITDHLQREGLMSKVKGIAAGSGGTLPAAHAASGSNFSHFQKHFPKEGWGGFTPYEPKISQEYNAMLVKTLPEKFEELPIPLGISLTEWEDELALKKFDAKRSRGFVASSGNLHDALGAAVVTSGPHPSCPNCTKGFWPKRVAGRYPVTDGAFGDMWGARGLAALPQTTKVLQLLPLDYPEQLGPPSSHELPYIPKEVVSLVLVQPPIASHGYILENFPMHELLSTKKPAYWNQLMYERAGHGMNTAMDQQVQFRTDANGMKQAVVPLDTDLTGFETFGEQLYDKMLSRERDRFWAFYSESGRKAWGDLYLSWKINSKVNEAHNKRFFEDIIKGRFGPRVGKPDIAA